MKVAITAQGKNMESKVDPRFEGQAIILVDTKQENTRLLDEQT